MCMQAGIWRQVHRIYRLKKMKHYIGRNLFGLHKDLYTSSDWRSGGMVDISPELNGIVCYNKGDVENSHLHRVHWMDFGEPGYYNASGLIYSDSDVQVQLDVCDEAVKMHWVTPQKQRFSISGYAYRYVDAASENNPYNGFFDVEYEDGPDAPKVYVENLKIEKRGGGPSPWCPAIEDLAGKYLKFNMINGTSTQWTSWLNFIGYDLPNQHRNIGIDFYGNDIEYLVGVEFRFKDVEYSSQETKDAFSGNTIREGDNIMLACTEVNSNSWNSTYILRNELPKNNTSYKADFRAIWSNLAGSSLKVKHIRVSILYDWIASGQLAYRKLYCKPVKDISAPLWCKSEMDLANPNAVHFETPNNSEKITKMSLGDYRPSDNLYIDYGYRFENKEEINIGITIFREKDADESVCGTYTISFYLKGRGMLRPYCNEHTADWIYGDTNIFEDRIIFDYSEWTRYEKTFEIRADRIGLYEYLTIAMDTARTESDFIIAGIKLERGDHATAWKPSLNALSETLEFAPSEENKITFNLLE